MENDECRSPNDERIPNDQYPMTKEEDGLIRHLTFVIRHSFVIRASSFGNEEQPMADRIALQVVRYRPEMEAEPTFQEYEVPLHKDWVVLDGLNHVKDQIDGTLSYRWSCRMGICGSCGMTVNGEPKLTCATFLTDYAPGPVRVEPLRNFPVIRDL